MRTRWKVAAAVVALALVVVAVVVVVRLLTGDDAGERARAADATFPEAALLAPPDAERVLWTDWGGIRDELGLDLDASSSAAEVDELVERGFESDLTAATALGESATVMQQRFGFSPATLAWELFTQSGANATLTMRLGGGVDTDDVAESLRDLGYDEPERADGTWTAGSDLSITGQVTPELAYVALDAADGLVFASDRSGGVDAARSAAAAADGRPVPAGVVDGLGRPLVALAYDATYACSALAMANADESEQREGETLVEQAGPVNPLTGFGIGVVAGGDVRLTMGFEGGEQARRNADSRARLLAGPAPGQGGDFPDRFTVRRVEADGDTVRVSLRPRQGEYVVSDLSSGPVLFATC